MEDGVTILGESNAIMIHLASKTKNDLYPEDRARRDQVNQWLFWDVAHWTPAYQPIQFERLVKQMLGQGPADEKVVEATLVKFKREAAYLVEVEWAPEDALPFALCLSALGPAPDINQVMAIALAALSLLGLSIFALSLELLVGGTGVYVFYLTIVHLGAGRATTGVNSAGRSRYNARIEFITNRRTTLRELSTTCS